MHLHMRKHCSVSAEKVPALLSGTWRLFRYQPLISFTSPCRYVGSGEIQWRRNMAQIPCIFYDSWEIQYILTMFKPENVSF